MAKNVSKRIRLPHFIFSTHSGIATSNFADRDLHKPFVCCGWMDIHTDDPPCKPQWTILVHKHHSQAVFISKNRKYESQELVDGETITFNSMSRHGIVPRSLALEIVERNSCNFQRYKDWRKSIDQRAMKPKLIFTFIGEDA